MRTLTILSLVVPIVLQLCIISLFIYRRLYKRLPWFFAYILYSVIRESLRLSVSANPKMYFRVYWWTEAVAVVFILVAVSESFLRTFRPESRLRQFKWVLGSSIGLALVYSFLQAVVFPPVRATRLVAIIIDLETTVNVALTAITIVYFTLAQTLRITNRQREAGVILGFGVNVSIAAFGFLLRSVFGTKYGFWAWIGPAAYIVAELIWTAEFSRLERTTQEPVVDLTFEEMKEVLGKYRKGLQALLERKK